MEESEINVDIGGILSHKYLEINYWAYLLKKSCRLKIKKGKKLVD